MTETDNPCLGCGACCSTKLWQIAVESDDKTPRGYTRSVRNQMDFASWEADVGVRAMRATSSGHCVALAGVVGRDARCRCYARRPAACADFPPGSENCLMARKAAGMGPFPAATFQDHHPTAATTAR